MSPHSSRLALLEGICSDMVDTCQPRPDGEMAVFNVQFLV